MTSAWGAKDTQFFEHMPTIWHLKGTKEMFESAPSMAARAFLAPAVVDRSMVEMLLTVSVVEGGVLPAV